MFTKQTILSRYIVQNKIRKPLGAVVVAQLAVGWKFFSYGNFWEFFCNFNFSDDDDHHGIQLNSLANTVDEALLRYDIDAKTCLARTMCSEYQKRSDDKRTVDRLSRGIIENIAE